MSTLVNIVILIFLFQEVFSSTKISKYEQFSAMDGHKCPSPDNIFDIDNVVSIVECMKVCSSVTECASISYESLTQNCIGCSDQFNSNNGVDVFENSLFYKRIECPGSNGIIQLQSNFRVKIYTEKKNREDAEKVCVEELSGRLVILDEEWKMNAVSNLLQICSEYNRVMHFWVDGARTGNQSVWKFADGSHMLMSQTAFWRTGEPDRTSPKDGSCASLRSLETDLVYRFNDRPCTVWYSFLCEY